jgi:hypothetical protein
MKKDGKRLVGVIAEERSIRSNQERGKQHKYNKKKEG